MQCAFVPRWVLSVVTTLEIEPPASLPSAATILPDPCGASISDLVAYNTRPQDSKISPAWEKFYFISQLFSDAVLPVARGLLLSDLKDLIKDIQTDRYQIPVFENIYYLLGKRVTDKLKVIV